MTGEMKDALEACPFCGAGQSQVSLYQDIRGYWTIGCGCCGSHSGILHPNHKSNARELIIASWNRRALLSTDKAVGEWQPIEAYPKSEPAYDEIVLLAWGDRVVPGRWVSNAGYQGFQPLSMIARKWDEPAQPTDFMRLPKPPALTASRASETGGRDADG